MNSRTAEPIQGGAEGAGLRVGVVVSRFNEEIVAKLLERARAELGRLGVRPGNVTEASVPGALEIPLVLQWMAQSEHYDALVAIGAVIRGETRHFEVVAGESARGVMDVALEFGIPVANGILTTEDEAQALARLDKGAEAVRVAIEMARLRGALAENWR
ncbi:MAG TPA: 6,7-dimethyl-8-ribityllumazine synthase [Burkholderiales bacterium]|nr:6,7-dimethyl-8-ribityllumazine synthase [Burkholderiales bacterium]